LNLQKFKEKFKDYLIINTDPKRHEYQIDLHINLSTKPIAETNQSS